MRNCMILLLFCSIILDGSTLLGMCTYLQGQIERLLPGALLSCLIMRANSKDCLPQGSKSRNPHKMFTLKVIASRATGCQGRSSLGRSSELTLTQVWSDKLRGKRLQCFTMPLYCKKVGVSEAQPSFKQRNFVSTAFAPTELA